MPYRLAIRFAIAGDLRFLSHQDSMRLFERAAIRAELPLRFSGGFNPRPRISLPLPRPVGIASDDELLVLELAEATSGPPVSDLNGNDVHRRLAPRLPAGVRILDVHRVGAVPQPQLVSYRLALGDNACDVDLAGLAGKLLAAEKFVLARQVDDAGALRDVDIRPFIEEVAWSPQSGELRWSLRVVAGRSARPAELLTAVGLDANLHLYRVVRTRVEWKEQLLGARA